MSKAIRKPAFSLTYWRVKEMTPLADQEQGSRAKIVPIRPDERAVEPGQRSPPRWQGNGPPSEGGSSRSDQHDPVPSSNRLSVGLSAPRPSPQKHRLGLLCRLAEGRHVAETRRRSPGSSSHGGRP